MKIQQNKIWMTYLATGISLLILMASCEKVIEEAPIKHVTFTYINESQIDLDMEVYNVHDDLFKSFSIEDGDSINSHTSHIQGIGAFYFASTTYEAGDSVIVRFADGKCFNSVKYQDNELFTPNGYDNYSEELMEQSTFTLYYTFTVEDYNLAVDCN